MPTFKDVSDALHDHIADCAANDVKVPRATVTIAAIAKVAANVYTGDIGELWHEFASSNPRQESEVAAERTSTTDASKGRTDATDVPTASPCEINRLSWVCCSCSRRYGLERRQCECGHVRCGR